MMKKLSFSACTLGTLATLVPPATAQAQGLGAVAASAEATAIVAAGGLIALGGVVGAALLAGILRRSGRAVAEVGRGMDTTLTHLLAQTRETRLLVEARAEALENAIRGQASSDAILLSHALAGELRAVHAALELHLVRLESFLRERQETGYTKVGNRDLLPVTGTPVFDALAGRIGLLGGSLAGDVAWLYGRLDGWRRAEQAAASRPGTLPLEDAFALMDGIEDLADGVLHLMGRLLGFADGDAGELSAQALVRLRAEARADLDAGPDGADVTLAVVDEGEDESEDWTEDEDDRAAPSSRPPIDDVLLNPPGWRR